MDGAIDATEEIIDKIPPNETGELVSAVRSKMSLMKIPFFQKIASSLDSSKIGFNNILDDNNIEVAKNKLGQFVVKARETILSDPSYDPDNNLVGKVLDQTVADHVALSNLAASTNKKSIWDILYKIFIEPFVLVGKAIWGAVTWFFDLMWKNLNQEVGGHKLITYCIVLLIVCVVIYAIYQYIKYIRKKRKQDRIKEHYLYKRSFNFFESDNSYTKRSKDKFYKCY